MHVLNPGDTVNNRYSVVRKLGAGAMGTVYLCEDLVESKIQVALKVLVSDNLDDQDAWAKGEYEALTRLRHPNLARVYNFGRIGDSKDYFIVSEFIKGVDLFAATEYVNYEELNDIIVQTCRALEYIHSRGYVHFDVKPDNILVTRHKTFGLQEGSKIQQLVSTSSVRNKSLLSTPNVKLIDFGLAERMTGSFSFAIKGTLNYLAPEIINGQTPDQRADLYSLGVTLYQITNRNLPNSFSDDVFESTNFQQLKRSELFEMHMKKVPEYLRKVILRLLEEDPAQRFQSAREVIQFISLYSGQQYDVETKETQKSYLHSTRMVGRKKEIHVLKNIAEKTFAHSNVEFINDDLEAENVISESESQEISSSLESGSSHSLVLVTGEMGIGKSRILEEFQHYLKLNDIRHHTGNCYEGSSNAYQPFVEILRQLVVGLGLSSEICARYRNNLGKLLPELRERESGEDSGSSTDLEKKKRVFIDRITQFLLEAANEAPYVLTLNNLHWADEVSLELLDALVDCLEVAQKEQSVGLMLVVSLRIDEQHNEQLKNFLNKHKDNKKCQDIYLRRLKRSQIVELLSTMLGFTEIPEAFISRLEEKTGGNPLFIQETLKALQDEGVLKHTLEGWQIKTTGYNRIELPNSLEDLLLQRVRRLEPIKQEILEIMSVLNRPISPKILQKFKRFISLPILVHLRNLEEAGLVSKVFEGGKLSFQIDQPKMREILYTHLEDDVRCRLHGEVGELFSELYKGHEEEILEDLAFHYQRSDLQDKAIAMALRAGDRLKAIYANDRALEFYFYIIEKIQDDEEQKVLWIQTQEKVGELCTTIGRYDLAENSYDLLLRRQEVERVPEEDLCRYYLKKGKIFEIQGDYDTALRCYKDARSQISEKPANSCLDERIRVIHHIAWVYVCMGKYEKAMTIAVEALKGIENSREKIEHAMIYSTIGSANFYKGNFSQAVEYHSRSLKIQENLENVPAITECLNNLGKAYMASADYSEAREHLLRALETSNEVGDPFGKGKCYHNLGALSYELGELKEAEEHVDQSLQLSRTYNMRFLNIENYILHGKIKREQRDYSRAESHLFRALTAFSKQGNRWGLCTVLLEIVTIHRLRGNSQEAASMAEEAMRYAVEMDIDLLRSRCMLAKSRVQRDSSEVEPQKLIEQYERVLSDSSKLENPELRAEILREIGDLLVKDRKLEEAKKHYKKAEELLREVLERLPEDLQEVYKEKHRRYFQLDNSVLLTRESSPHPSEESDNGEGTKILKKSQAEKAQPKANPSQNPRNEIEALECVNDLMRQLNESVDLQEFLEFLLSRVLEISRARYAMVLSRRDSQLYIRRSQKEGGAKVEKPGDLIVLKLALKAFQTQRPLTITDLIRDPNIGMLGGLIKAGHRSLLMLPYKSLQEEGMLYLVDPAPRHTQLADDLTFYTFFTNLLPMAIAQLDQPLNVSVIEEA